MPHAELEQVELALLNVNSNIKTENYDLSFQNVDRSIELLGHIKDKFQLSLKNIF